MPKKRLRISRASQLDNEKKKEMKENELKLPVDQREDHQDEMSVHTANSDKMGSRTKRPKATSTPHRHKTEHVSTTVPVQPAANHDILPSTDHTSPHHTTAHRLSSFASALSPDMNTSLEVTWDYRKTESTPPAGSDKDLSDILYHFPAIDSPLSTRNSSPLSLSIIPMNITNRRSVRNSKDKEGFEKLRHLASRLCGHQQALPCDKAETNGVEGEEENENISSDVDSICDRESMLDQFFADTDDSLEDENQSSTPPIPDHDQPPNHHTVHQHTATSHSLLPLCSTAVPYSSSFCPPKSTPSSAHPPDLSSHHYAHPLAPPPSARPPPVSSLSTVSTPAHQSAATVDDLDDDGDDMFWAMAANALDETERQLQKEKELNETIDKLFFNPVDSPLAASSCIKVCSQEDIEKKRQLAKRKLKQRLQTI